MNFMINETAQKLRGGYYTPDDLAVFIARWVGQTNPERVLEPSCGDGAFFAAMASAGGFSDAEVVGFELDKSEATKARRAGARAGLKTDIHARDFLSWALANLENSEVRFDAVVGNPPFIRYQYLPAEFQVRAEEVFRQLNCKFTKHTNAWVPFILASFALLRPGGRLAMVVPSEIIHVMHAQSLRTYLGENCRRLVVIDPEEIWFSDTLQGAVILLAEKRDGPKDKAEGLGVYPVRAREFTRLNPEDVFTAPQSINGKTVAGKWTRAFLDKSTRDLFDELVDHPEVYRFKDVAQVDVGIVTGANKFFLVDDEVVDRYGLGEWAHPMFGRSEHCPGVIYDDAQHQENARKGNPTNFIWFPEGTQIKKKSVQQYIALGESEDLHKRYKTRIRPTWYSVPSVYKTEIGMLKRAHNIPRLILNSAGAYTTDTAYRIRSRSVDAETLVSAFINPLTALSAELEGRYYGGGVLELVPSEIERMIIPIPKKAQASIVDLDKAVRSLPADQLLQTYGARWLSGLGLGAGKAEQLFMGWRGLKHRRHRTTSEDAES